MTFVHDVDPSPTCVTQSGAWAAGALMPMPRAEAAIWTPVQFLNFRLLPVQHQQMFVNFMSIVEAAVLSWCASPTFVPMCRRGPGSRGPEVTKLPAAF